MVFRCDICPYESYRRDKYNCHLDTRKHKNKEKAHQSPSTMLVQMTLNGEKEGCPFAKICEISPKSVQFCEPQFEDCKIVEYRHETKNGMNMFASTYPQFEALKTRENAITETEECVEYNEVYTIDETDESIYIQDKPKFALIKSQENCFPKSRDNNKTYNGKVLPIFDTSLPVGNKNDIPRCKDCNKLLSNKYGLKRHEVTCKVRINKENEEKTKLKNEIQSLKAENVMLQKDHEIEKKDIEIQYLKKVNQIQQESTKMINTNTTNILKYATLHFTNPRELNSMNNLMINEESSNEEKEKVIDMLISSHNHNNGPKYISEFIIPYYKSGGIEKQSFHNSDVDRKNFIFFEKNWKWDKKGLKVMSLIIDPMLQNLKRYLDDSLLNGHGKMLNLKRRQQINFAKNLATMSEISMQIEDFTYHREILAILAPVFHLDVASVKLLC